MKKLLMYLTVAFFISCNGQIKIDPIGKFESELSDKANDIFQRSSPLPFSEKLYAGSSYYASSEQIGSSGANVLFDLNEHKLETLNKKLKTYAKLENTNLKPLDYNFNYSYQNRILLLPNISDDWNDVLIDSDIKNNEVEIYLIEVGQLNNVFKQKSAEKLNYNYSCGVYFYRKKNKLIYWFALYK